MKKLSALLFCLIFSFTSFTCLAAGDETKESGSSEPETVVLIDDIAISYLTTVIDLNTGVEYHAKSGNPCTIEAEIGHQYSVVTTATTPPIQGYITACTRYSVGDNGLSININFDSNGGTHTHAYSFILPEGTKLSYVDKTGFSNEYDRIVFNNPSWERLTGKKGVKAYLNEDWPISNGFILEVVEANTDTTGPVIPLWSFKGGLLIVFAAVGIIAIVRGIFNMIKPE